MIAFQRNFIFVDETNISQQRDDSLSTIVVQHRDFALSDFFQLRTPWVEMSGRNVRYYTKEPFEKTQHIVDWAFEVEDVVVLWWCEESEIIYYKRRVHFTVERLLFWVLHTFFPLVLELSHRYHILHTAAVALGDGVILFSAFSGGGKSTLLNYFLQQGHSVYGDDTVAIKKQKNRYHVVASYPFHRPFREIEVLGDSVKNFARTIRPLAKMYLLERVDKNAKVCIVPLHGVEKFKAVYQSAFVTFSFLQQQRYRFSVEMVKHIQVYKISIPWDKNRLEEVYQAILIDNDV